MMQKDSKNHVVDWVEKNNFDPIDTTRLGIYRSNGKEKDYESGFHYYGARYYWSETLTGWLSVYPMMDKYPNVSPYNYCAWNPIKLIDPDGREISTHTDEDGNVKYVYDDGDLGIYKHTQSEIDDAKKYVSNCCFAFPILWLWRFIYAQERFVCFIPKY